MTTVDRLRELAADAPGRQAYVRRAAAKAVKRQADSIQREDHLGEFDRVCPAPPAERGVQHGPIIPSELSCFPKPTATQHRSAGASSSDEHPQNSASAGAVAGSTPMRLPP